MVGMGIMTSIRMGTRRICIFSSPFSYPIEKVGYFPYPYLVNVGIPYQNDE